MILQNLLLLVIERKAEGSFIINVRDLAHRGENLSNALKDLTSLFHKISTAQMIVDEKQISSEIIDLCQQNFSSRLTTFLSNCNQWSKRYAIILQVSK